MSARLEPRRHVAPLLRFLIFVVGVGAPALADATAQRTFVASSGNDANTAFNCSIANPCRGFAAAIGVTIANGEIIVLDSAGYGPVTITQSVSIIAPSGVYGGISVASGDGVTINAPGGTVVLRGLSINGRGGNVGINVTSAAVVHLENVIVSNMLAQGVLTNSGGKLLIRDSILRDNGSDGIAQYAGAVVLEHVRSDRNAGRGLYVFAGTTSIDSSTFQQNLNNGFRIDGGTVSARASVLSFNQGNGVFVSGFAPGTHLTLDGCMVDSNSVNGIGGTGSSGNPAVIVVTGGHVNYNGAGGAGRGIFPGSVFVDVTLSGVTAFGNGTWDVDATTGSIYTFQNNSVDFRTGANVFTNTYY